MISKVMLACSSVYLVFFMRSFHPWHIFPHDLESPAAKSLALLFILQEFLASLQLLERSKNNIPAELPDISLELEQFLVFSLDNLLTKNGGALDKLCFYCESLLQASKISDDTILLVLEEMRNSILNVKSRLVAWKKKLLSKEEAQLNLAALYGELDKKFRAFFSALSVFLKESRTNENVLIYILEHRDQFNRSLGPRTIENLLCRLFPSGPCELRAAICEGYTRRGFADFYALQEPLLDAVEWETCSCPPSVN